MKKILISLACGFLAYVGVILTIAISIDQPHRATAQGANSGSEPYLAAGLTGTVVTIKSAAGQLMWGACNNTGSADAFIQVFDVVGAVTLGVTVPKLALPVPKTSVIAFGPIAANFFAAIKIAATSTANGATPPNAAPNCSFTFR